MLQIKTTGFEDFLDDSLNIKALIIGGPGAGKTRSSSFWPKPFLIDCEDGRKSIADRAVPYVRVRTSKDMLDVLAYLKSLERTPKAQRKHQTVIVDTGDAFSRIVKEEWVTDTGAASFTGFDAWGYLDTKMQLLFTRLLNLDYNVLVHVHYKEKTHKDGDNTVREFGLQLQGAIAEQVYNDFDLVGWMGTYWEAGEEGREQKRGLTFNPTPAKPFLKDRSGVLPKHLPITFTDNDYEQILQAFLSRVEEAGDEMAESQVLEQVPDHAQAAREEAAAGVVSPDQGGGPLPPRPPAEVPLEKKLVGELKEIAKELGIAVRGNSLKSELLIQIKEAQAKRLDEVKNPVAGDTPSSDPSPSPTGTPDSPSTPTTPPPTENDPWLASSTTGSSTGTSGSPQNDSEPTPTAEPSEAAPPAAEADSPASEPAEDAEAIVAAELGASVIHEEPADTPDTQPATPSATADQPSAPRGPSACADCGTHLTPLFADPAKKQAIRQGFIKHRKYKCPACLDEAA